MPNNVKLNTSTVPGNPTHESVDSQVPKPLPKSENILPVRTKGVDGTDSTSPPRKVMLSMAVVAGPSDAAKRVVTALETSSAVDHFLLNSPIAEDKADVHRFADAIAKAGDCIVLRHHPRTYGKINHISAMVVKRLDDGNYKIGVAHHESINLAKKPSVEDGAMLSAAGIRWDTYDTRSLFKSLGQDVPLEKLPVSTSAIQNGFPASTIIPCGNPDQALAYIALETQRSQKMLKTREMISEAMPHEERRPLDGVPPYAFGQATKGATGHAFYTPSQLGATSGERAAAMKSPARQVNTCFEYAAGVLMSAEAVGAKDVKLGMPQVALVLGPFAPIVGGMAPTDKVLEQMSKDGVKDVQSLEAFRWLGKRWGEMQPAIKQWDVTSSRPAASRL